MIQNINFPEGTQVSFAVGSVFDQFNKDIEINFSPGSSQSLYANSRLSSARKLNGPYGYAFYSSNAIFRPHISDTHMYQYGLMYYDVILDKSEEYSAEYLLANSRGGKNNITISGNFSYMAYFLSQANSNMAHIIN